MAKLDDDITLYGDQWRFGTVDINKNFYITSANSAYWGFDERVALDDLKKERDASRSNIDIFYDGGMGSDVLDYDGDITSIKVEATSYAGYELYFEGGRGKNNNSKNLESLEVWTRDVETIKLGRNDDEVDMSGLTSDLDVQFFAANGNDLMLGSSFRDWFHGGDGQDQVFGKHGNDILNGGDGNDTVSGGRGNDVLYASLDLTTDDTNDYYGDWDIVGQDHNGNDVFGAEVGQYNEADVFVIGYEATSTQAVGPVSGGSSWQSFLEEEATTAVAGTAGKIMATALGASWSNSLFEFGFTAIADAVTSGAGAETVYTTSTAKTASVAIHDFDPWSDAVAIALDGYANNIIAAPGDTSKDKTLQVSLSSPFLTLTVDDLSSSAYDGMFENDDLETLNSFEIKDILQNVLNNSVHVWTEGGVLHATSKNGVNLLNFDGGALSDLDAVLGSSDGVWLLGNYGGGTMFGHSLEALAGSNHDDVLYSGNYDGNDHNANSDEQGLPSYFFSNSRIKVFAGDGDDIVFGSEAADDDLFGGKGDDYLHVVAAGTGAQVSRDNVFGGEGTDVASFSEISVANGATEGIKISLAELESDAADSYATDYAEVFYLQSNTYAIARLYDIEGVEGTKFGDTLTGDETDNILFGSGGDDLLNGAGGADTIEGGSGDDVLTGGAGVDTFLFSATSGDDRVTDMTTQDILVFEGLNDIEVAHLQSSLQANADWVEISGGSKVTIDGVDVSDLSVQVTANAANPANFDVALSLSDTAAVARAADPRPLSDVEAYTYLASHWDLIEHFGLNIAGARAHYETYGRNEVRDFDFNAEQYLANYSDLSAAFGTDTLRATAHFIQSGYYEGRTDGANLTDGLSGSAARQSTSYHGGTGAEHVLDGDITTINHTARGDASPWLRIDLLDSAEIDLVMIENRQDNWTSSRLDGAIVEILDEGTVVWTSEDLSGAPHQTIQVGGVVGDQVRIAHDNGTFLHIGEIDIYGDYLI